MSAFRRHVALLLLVLFLAAGCKSLMMLPFYLTSDEPKKPAELYKLADKDKKKEVKVVIVTETELETRAELTHADKEISRLFALHLQKLCKENGENISVVNPLKVEEYKNNTDSSESHLDLEALGKHFKADYVIYLEVSGLSLYQPGTANQFFQGRANVHIKLVNVNKPEDFSVSPYDFSFSWPPENQGGNKLADLDTPPQMFRQRFLNALGRRLSWFFTDQPTSAIYHSDD